MFECERPKGPIPGFGPFAHLVEQHGTRPIGNGLDGSFGDTILKVSTDAAEVQFWIQELDISLEFGGAEGMVISSVFLDCDTMKFGKTFKLVLASQGFTSS